MRGSVTQVVGGSLLAVALMIPLTIWPADASGDVSAAAIDHPSTRPERPPSDFDRRVLRPDGDRVPQAPDTDVTPYVIGGDPAAPGQYPWAALLVIDTPRGAATCGGTLVKSRWILTAAHCIVDALDVHVLVGAISRWRSAGWARARSVYVHHGYDPTRTGVDDIGVVELRRRVKKRPMPLAMPKEAGVFRPGRMATVAGWGITGPHRSLADTLQKATVPIRRAADCRALFDGFRRAVNLCAGFRRSEASAPAGACAGDSGGPLFAFTGYGPVQVGIVSYGRGRCTLLDRPAVYMRVDAYRAAVDRLVGGLPGRPRRARCNGVPATMAATSGDDEIVGTATRDVIVARGGPDEVRARGGDDLVCLGPGEDRVSAGSGSDVVRGGSGGDLMNGDDGPDLLLGASGRDTARGQRGADRINGGDGVDLLVGGGGNDTLNGQGRGDVIAGGAGADTLNGGPGDDDLDGGPAVDVCNGHAGIDVARRCETTRGVP